MANPMRAKDLVVEDAMYSRGMVVDEGQLVNEERQIDRHLVNGNRGGKGKLRELNGGGHGFGHPASRGQARRRTSSTSSLSQSGMRLQEQRSKGNEMDGMDDDADLSGDGEGLIPLHSRPRDHRRHRPRQRQRGDSILSGLLAKEEVPAELTKAELNRAFWRRLSVTALFILAW